MLLLLLLFINCDFKSQGEYLIKQGLVKNKGSELKNDLFQKFEFKEPVVQSLEARDIGKLILEDVIDGSSGAVVKEKSVSLKIDEFLNECGISAQDRELNVYLRDCLASSDFDHNLFYTLLTEIGVIKTKELFESLLQFSNLITEIKLMVENIKRERSKQQLISEINLKSNYFCMSKDLRGLFENGNSYIEIYNLLKNTYNMMLKGLLAIKNRIEYLIKGEAIYEGLTSRTKQIVDDIRKLIIFSDVSDGIYDEYGYNDHEFYSVLGFLGVYKFIKLFKYNLRELFRVRKEAENAIQTVRDDSLLETLQTEFNMCNKEAVGLIQRVFSIDSDYIIENIIIDSSNSIVNKFMKIKEQTQDLINFIKLEKKLSNDDFEVLKYLRNILTNPNIGREYEDKYGIRFKTYSDYEFELLIGGFSEHQFSEVILKIRRALRFQDNISQSIDFIRDNKIRHQLKTLFTNQKKHYEFLLKTTFHCIDIKANSLYDTFMFFRDDEDEFNAIKDEILKLDEV
ncbi:hypothetical protein BOFE_09460 (plasmid) [Candidatus Borrelia fainii]|uniref:Lipoprotein n=2 Tax=Candidatus Borrelia fainii TaxID=2518322 RepID=A0ABN6USM9_9SPIR|nr:hypothetical protein BOFE_09460 [Candidatus Borrelia fainii]